MPVKQRAWHSTRPIPKAVHRGLRPTSAVPGFTLIELVVGIVVFSIALTIVTSLVVPQAVRSIDPIYQVRAAELAQTLLNEISAKSFDEASNRAGGTIRCGENGTTCTAAANFGPDGVAPNQETRDNFDDVDDYDAFDFASNGPSLLVNNSSLYQGYNVTVQVIYDGNFNGVYDAGNEPAERAAKLVRLTVTLPSGDTMQFAAYRSNY